MKILRKFWFLPLILAVLILLASFTRPFKYYPNMSVEVTRQTVNAALPSGSGKERVLAYLMQKGWENSGYVAGSQTIHALQRNTCWTPLVECSTELTFAFDTTGMLIRTDVAEVLTGL